MCPSMPAIGARICCIFPRDRESEPQPHCEVRGIISSGKEIHPDF